MPYSKEQNEYYLEKVRMVMVLRGSDVSCREVVELLAKNKVVVSKNYVGRLKNKIFGEMEYRARYYAYHTAIPDIENSLAETIRQTWAIAVNPDTMPSVKLQALKEVRDAKQQLIDNLLKVGKLNKVPEKIAVYRHDEHEIKLPPELLAAIECLEMQMKPGPEPVQYIDEKPKELPVEKAITNDTKPKRVEIQFQGGTLSSEPDLP